MLKQAYVVLSCAVVLVLANAARAAESPYSVAWIQQLGTSSSDESRSVAVDGAGNVFISGRTDGIMGEANFGGVDAFLTKYDPNGNKQWTEQLGTSGDDGSLSVAVDGEGNAFISGWTWGIMGETNAGLHDAFLTKYDPNGNKQWTRQLGTSTYDLSHSVAVDGDGNAFISGYTKGNLDGQTSAGGFDAFLTKYDPNGNKQWTKQLGTSSYEISYSVAVDGEGNAFISGVTEGSLGGDNAGIYDAFLAKYDPNGKKLWTEQLGTSMYDYSFSVAVDGAGNAFISGRTEGSLSGDNAGGIDTFLAKYAPNGNELWREQLGTSSSDESWSVAVDGAGNAFISGHTDGIMGEANFGGVDAFLAKYEVPEPATLSVEIDIKPGSYPNSINLGSHGSVPVAILTTEDFDATTVDPETVELAGATIAIRGNGKRWLASEEDVDDDGDIDLLVHVETENLALGTGATTVILTGETYDGEQFEGSDDIVIVRE